MRAVAVLLLCVATVACNRTEPTTATPPPVQAAAAPAPAAVAGKELSALEVAVEPEVSANCNLEAIDGVSVPDMNPIVPRERKFAVTGWLVDDVSKNVPAELSVRVYSISGDGRIWQFPATVGIERSDVHAVQGNTPEVLNSGFQSMLDLSDLKPAQYRLRLAYQRGDKLVVCDNGRSITLR